MGDERWVGSLRVIVYSYGYKLHIKKKKGEQSIEKTLSFFLFLIIIRLEDENNQLQKVVYGKILFNEKNNNETEKNEKNNNEKQ